MKKFRLFFLVLIVGIVLRVLYLLFFVDLDSDHYQEYGYIGYNIVEGRGFSLNYDSTNECRPYFNVKEVPYRSAYMPPAYVYYLVPFLMIDNLQIRRVSLCVSQIVLSAIVLWVIYILCLKLFDSRVALVGVLIYAVYPEFVFVVGVSGPIVHYHLLILAVLYLLVGGVRWDLWYICVLGVLLAIGVYIRTDFVLFVVFVGLYLMYRGYVREVVVIGCVVVVMMSPWLIRNYLVFDEVVLTTNGGFNLYRGHYDGESYPLKVDDAVVSDLKSNLDSVDFDIIQSRVFSRYAWEYSLNHKWESVFAGGVNILKFVLIETNDPRSYNPLYFVPWFVMLLVSVYGLWRSKRSRYSDYVLLLFICNVLIVFVFFAIPRFQILFKVVLLPYYAYGILLLYNRLVGGKGVVV